MEQGPGSKKKKQGEQAFFHKKGVCRQAGIWGLKSVFFQGNGIP